MTYIKYRSIIHNNTLIPQIPKGYDWEKVGIINTLIENYRLVEGSRDNILNTSYELLIEKLTLVDDVGELHPL